MKVPFTPGTSITTMASISGITGSNVYVSAQPGANVLDVAHAATQLAGQSGNSSAISRIVINTQRWQTPLLLSSSHTKALEQLAERSGITLAVKTGAPKFVHEFEPTAERARQLAAGMMYAAGNDDEKDAGSSDPRPDAPSATSGSAIVPGHEASEEPTVIEISFGDEVSHVEVGAKPPYEADPANRIPVANTPEELAAAFQHVENVLTTKLLPSFFQQPQHENAARTYFTDLITGAIAAPREEREAIVSFAAKGPEHTAAIISAVLDESIGESGPITFLPTLDDLRPEDFRKKAPLEKRPVQVEKLIEGDVKVTRDLLYFLRTDPRYQDAYAALGHEKPSSFGVEALKGIDVAAQVVIHANTMTDQQERMRYIIQAVSEGILPKKILKFSADPKQVTVPMPSDHPEISNETIRSFFHVQDRLTAFGNTDQDLAGNLRTAIQIFTATFSSNGVLSADARSSLAIIKDLAQSDPEAASQAFLRLRLSKVLKRAPLDGAMFDPITKSKITEIRIAIEQKQFARADALISGANSWFRLLWKSLEVVENLKVDLTLYGERKALRAFTQATTELLKAGDIDGLRELSATVKLSLSRHPREIAVSVNSIRFAGGVRATLAALVESTRVLALMPRDARATFVTAFPDVKEMVENGPFHVKTSLDRLRQLGMPLPGDPDIAALPLYGPPGTQTDFSILETDEEKTLGSDDD